MFLKIRSFLSLSGGLFRGIVAAVQGHGPPKMRASAPWGHFVKPRRPVRVGLHFFLVCAPLPSGSRLNPPAPSSLQAAPLWAPTFSGFGPTFLVHCFTTLLCIFFGSVSFHVFLFFFFFEFLKFSLFLSFFFLVFFDFHFFLLYCLFQKNIVFSILTFFCFFSSWEKRWRAQTLTPN